jgi:lipopolysaccharide transport system ATP-binding protein
VKLVSVESVGKSFREYSSEIYRFANWFGGKFKPSEEHWVLKDVSFSLNKGESLGLIGINGAGKSTLLKIIAETLAPTNGAVSINGTVSAILELGMGFSPDLTGRQNAIHSCGLLGFSTDEINGFLPLIQEFSEIGEYFDEPVRIYSTGMQVRVAFAVATARRPDVLIVDEALAVGDAYFQSKSFEKIKEFQKLGTSLIIVSHDKNSILTLCDRALLLSDGRVLKDGIAKDVFNFYNGLIASDVAQIKVIEEQGYTRTSSGSGEAVVSDTSIINSSGEIVETLIVGEKVTLRINVKANEHVDRLVLGYGIRDRLGRVVYGTNTHYTEQVIEDVAKGTELVFEIAFIVNFGVGNYSLQTALTNSNTHLEKNFEWKDYALVFDVVNLYKPAFDGCLWHNSKITIKY